MSSSSACVQVENLCTTKLKSHEVRFSWTIEDFDFHEARGEKLKSPTFTAITNDKYVFYLLLRPNGQKNSTTNDNISIFLYVKKFPDGVQSVFVKFTLDFLSQEKKVWSNDFNVTEFIRTTPNNGRNNIAKKEVLSGNKLTVRVHVTFSEKNNIVNNLLFRHESETAEGNLSSSFASLFEKQELSDAVISVKNKDYPVHKCILAARSPVFSAMFKHDTTENRLNRVTIEDIEENVMDEMLRYIYTGKCKNVDSLAEGLLAAADKYALDELKTICSSKLIKSLSVKNAANILLLAAMYHVDVLKSETIKFIACKSAEVIETDGWKNVLSVPELIGEVYKAVTLR